ncbi:MAG: type IV pilus twitching motility protein PilT [Myxococcaceae bacterium]
MITSTQVLQLLLKSDVSEVGIAGGRVPAVKIGGVFRPASAQSLQATDVVRILFECGMDVSALGATPARWSGSVQGIGTISVVAARQGDNVQARISLVSPVSPSQTTSAGEAAAPAQAATHKGAPASGPTTSARAAAVPVAEQVPRGPVRIRQSSLEEVLSDARSHAASDVHLIAGRPPMLRMAGELLRCGEVMDPARVEQLVRPLVPKRLLENLDRDGAADFALDQPGVGRFRANVSRQRTGLKGCFRIIGREIPTLESLGLPSAIAQATHHHQGLIIVTGPSGHGKTCTLSAIVDIINRETTHHVITVEDPIEYLHPRKKAMISQREVGTHTRTFQSALKGSLREDPDVIVVGELRDTETVRMALTAGETGHLLIATMNTPSAAKTIDRLIDLFPPADQGQVRMSLSVGLRLIVSQRLVPTADRRNVVAAVEVLPGSVSLGNLIRDEKTFQIPSLQQRGKSMGILRLDDSLADLVREGKTTLEIARDFAESPDELTAVIQGRRPADGPPPEQEGGGLRARMGNILGKKG